MRVSPEGKASSLPIPTCGQNWTFVSLRQNRASSVVGSRVHASPDVPRASKRQAKSLMAFADAWVPPNMGGSTAGTPPSGSLHVVFAIPLSHTHALPLPSGRDTTICRSGKELGSVWSQLNVDVATGRLLGPGLASTTMKKPSGTRCS